MDLNKFHTNVNLNIYRRCTEKQMDVRRIADVLKKEHRMATRKRYELET